MEEIKTEETVQKKRLITRSDFDGLVCAMLLKELDMIDEIKFVHPKDVQDGKVDINENDITTNLPFDNRVGLAFDHHESELNRINVAEAKGRFIIEGEAKSAARVVYNYYGGEKVFTRVSKEIMEAVDKGDSADFTKDEILNPTDWVLLNFLMDARTGLGRFHDFRISNYDLMMELISYCMDHSIDEVLELPDVKERVDLYFQQAVETDSIFKAMQNGGGQPQFDREAFQKRQEAQRAAIKAILTPEQFEKYEKAESERRNRRGGFGGGGFGGGQRPQRQN